MLDNALKFSPAGGEVNVGISASGSEALVVVTHSGPGVEPAERPRVFDRFHRGAASRASNVPGFGLGLAIGAGGHRAPRRTDRGGRGLRGWRRFSIRIPLAG